MTSEPSRTGVARGIEPPALLPPRMPSLDGLRAVSICLVLFGHLAGTRDFPVTKAGSKALGDLAHLGVLVFFVISGFLITSLLMAERDMTGSISLRRFYGRRALRIFPAFYVLLLALLVAAMLGVVSLSARDFAVASGYLVNYYPHPPWQIGHLWSLAIEEQFYLLWPLALLVLDKRRGLILALAAMVLAPVLRLAMAEYVFHVNPQSMLRDLPIFPAVFDYIATGCALALLRPWMLQQSWYLRFTASRWLFLLIPAVLLVCRFDGYTMVDAAGAPVMNVGMAVLVDASVRHPNSIVGRLLNWRPIATLGVLSYSLYLWQQPFIDRGGTHWVNAFPQNLILSLVAATVSYVVVERSFLKLRSRLRRRGFRVK